MKAHKNKLINLLLVLVLMLTPVINIYSSELVDCEMDNNSQSQTAKVNSGNTLNSPCHEEPETKALSESNASKCCCDDNGCGCIMTGVSFIQVSHHSLGVLTELSGLLSQNIFNTLTTYIPSLHKPPIA